MVIHTPLPPSRGKHRLDTGIQAYRDHIPKYKALFYMIRPVLYII